MALISLNTVDKPCSVAIRTQTGQICHLSAPSTDRHAESMIQLLDDARNAAGYPLDILDAVAFGCGPGDFTGCRIAWGIAQALALSMQKPIIPISNLAATAWRMFQIHPNTNTVLAVLDARMGEVYWAMYRQDPKTGVRAITQETLCHPTGIAVPESTAPIVAAGAGWDLYQRTLTPRMPGVSGHLSIQADARAILELAEQAPHHAYTAPLGGECTYLRPDACIPTPPKSPQHPT